MAVAVGAALAIVLLIGFNATSIAADERARDHATCFAFGVPVATILRLNLVESALVGGAGTVLGVGAGFVVLRVLVAQTVARRMPDIGLMPTLALTTLALAAVARIVAVAISPLFTLWRLWRVDIPATLRVTE